MPFTVVVIIVIIIVIIRSYLGVILLFKPADRDRLSRVRS